jgi:transcriptional regulator with XRE-family HTH domain
MNANGSNDFGQMLATIMQEQNLTQLQLSRRLGCSQAAVGRWLRGYAPRDLMRAKVLAKLRQPAPEPKPKPELIQLVGPVKVAIVGEGVELNMQISPITARRIMQVLLTDNE